MRSLSSRLKLYMHRALESPLEVDLRPFSRHLARRQIPHRITERGGIQELWVPTPQAANLVRVLYTAFIQDPGDDASESSTEVIRHSLLCELSALVQRFPLTILLIFAALLVGAITRLGEETRALAYFTIVELHWFGDHIGYQGLASLRESHAWWRLWSPMLLHFHMFHLVFNLVWIWVLGARIEALQGSFRLVLIVAMTALAANLGEYMVSGPLFGGYSGVVFGLLGYVWLAERLDHGLRFGLPAQLMGLMLAWLALGYTGLLAKLGFGEVANTAHTAGLLSGLAMALLLLKFPARGRQPL